MKKALLILIALIVLIFITTLFSQDFTYVGSSKCKMCHKTEKQGQQFPIWESSKHASSSEALTSPDAAAKAQEMGVDNPAESPECLKCHSPLFEKAPDLKAEGVTCEACHGPGSEYKKMSVMKNREEAVANGLVAYDSPEAIKAQCMTCHESAHGTAFDFDASWEKIKHAKPEE